MNKIKEKKQYYAILHILEILYENKKIIFKNKIHLYKRLKNNYECIEKYLQKLNTYNIFFKNLYPKMLNK